VNVVAVDYGDLDRLRRGRRKTTASDRTVKRTVKTTTGPIVVTAWLYPNLPTGASPFKIERSESLLKETEPPIKVS